MLVITRRVSPRIHACIPVPSGNDSDPFCRMQNHALAYPQVLRQAGTERIGKVQKGSGKFTGPGPH
jgi:hypothetical protein